MILKTFRNEQGFIFQGLKIKKYYNHTQHLQETLTLYFNNHYSKELPYHLVKIHFYLLKKKLAHYLSQKSLS